MVKENPKRRVILINTGHNGRAGTEGGPPINSGSRRALVENRVRKRGVEVVNPCGGRGKKNWKISDLRAGGLRDLAGKTGDRSQETGVRRQETGGARIDN